MTEMICICGAAAKDVPEAIWQKCDKAFVPYTDPCPRCHRLGTTAESKHAGGHRVGEGQNPRKPPTLHREFKGELGEISLGFYEEENGAYSVGTGKIVKISRDGVHIEKPLSPSEIEKAKKK